MTLARLVAAACAAWLVTACSTATTHHSATDTIAAAPTEAPAFGDRVESTAPTLASTNDGELTSDDDRMVCRSQARIGTKITRTICRRQSEVEAAERNARDSVDSIQRKAASQTTWTADPANP